MEARALELDERERALAYLEDHPRDNLPLIEMVAALGRPAPRSEAPPRLLALWRGRDLVGVASLRPSVNLDIAIHDAALAACVPHLARLEGGLIKCSSRIVAPLWRQLRARGRRALIDRSETTYVLRPDRRPAASPARTPPGTRVRRARPHDLDALVFAARASLREEDRPDPFDGDPIGFRSWVCGRIERARVVECEGEVVFVGYADVRRREGWLLQGIYTWPEQRRRGFAMAGLRGFIDEAFAEGADHIQLAVIDDNLPALALYREVGFEPFSSLRTILFV